MQENTLETAVLFVVYNRLETSMQVFSRIREARPKRLYCASDAAKNSKDEEKVNAVRNYILDNIDWDCEIKTLFREKNLGCGLGVKNAIDWFFANEEDGIILEDDVVPDKSFFRYCEELLERYRDDTRIGMISGNNHLDFSPEYASYLFSPYKSTWGWATWRRAWINMDLKTSWDKTEYRSSIIRNMGCSSQSDRFWEHTLSAIKSGAIDAWDYQWFLALSSQNQLSVVPGKNLVANIGYGSEATHTFGTPKSAYTTTSSIEFPLRHPIYIVPDYAYADSNERNIRRNVWKTYIPLWVKSFLRGLLRH